MADDREPYGRLVRETWVTCVRDRCPDPKPSWVESYDETDDFQREADMRIGAAVAVRAVHDAGLDLAARDMEILRLRAELARLRSVLLEGGQDAGTARRRALEIIGKEAADGR